MTHFFPEPNDVIYCLSLPRVLAEPNFNSILGMEIKSYLEVHIPCLFEPAMLNAQST